MSVGLVSGKEKLNIAEPSDQIGSYSHVYRSWGFISHSSCEKQLLSDSDLFPLSPACPAQNRQRFASSSHNSSHLKCGLKAQIGSDR
ncbi:hypothetical protein FKM82_012918 [Ascaphus truei]